MARHGRLADSRWHGDLNNVPQYGQQRITYLHGTPGNTNGNNADTIQVNVNDNGNTGSGGGTNIDFGTANVDIGAVNDAPVNTVPGTHGNDRRRNNDRDQRHQYC